MCEQYTNLANFNTFKMFDFFSKIPSYEFQCETEQCQQTKYCSHKAVDTYILTHCSSIKCLFHPMFFMPHLLHAQSTVEECSKHQLLVNLHATQHICPVNHGRVLQASTSGQPTAQHLCFSCFMPSQPCASSIDFWSPYNPTVCASAVSCSCPINHGRVLQASTSGRLKTEHLCLSCFMPS